LGTLIADQHKLFDVDLDFGVNGFWTWINGEFFTTTSWSWLESRMNKAEVWARLGKSFGRAFVRAAGKIDFARGLETFYYPKLESGVRIMGSTFLNAAVSREVHKPSTWELWAPFDTLNPYLRIEGNWELLPEYCWAQEIGLRGSNFSLNYYRLDFHDYISVNTENLDLYTYENLTSWHTTGLEGFLNYPIRLYNADSSVMTEFVFGLSGNSFLSGDSVPYMPDYNAIASLSIRRATEKLSLGLALQGEVWGIRYDIFDDEFDGFNVFSVAGLVKFITLSCVARVNNVFDTEYERIPHYPMPMRNFDVSIRWEFWD
jgi:hypothetical protein